MKAAAVISALSNELTYTLLMIITWIVLLGWSAAVVSACVLAFRNREEEDDEPVPVIVRTAPQAVRPPTPMGFGL